MKRSTFPSSGFCQYIRQQHIATLVAVLVLMQTARMSTADDTQQTAVFQSLVKPFLAANCLRCHGPDKANGDVTLHTVDASFARDTDAERWELVLQMLEGGEMPPDGEPQPDPANRRAVVAWIEQHLRNYVLRAERNVTHPTTRRLTNFEYENTIRDLIGINLKLTENLPKDPTEPYRFNNSAELMRIGQEQVDRYLECARRIMASAIVDPQPPEVHESRREWKPHGIERGMGADEISPWGNRRNTPASGMGLKSFPATGDYLIRIKASAILPPGIREMPLRLVMGYNLGENSATLQIEEVGTVRLMNTPDEPHVFEFRGRMENHPPRPGRTVNGKRQPATMTITPQNLYDDGTLNDGRRDLEMPRAVVEWMEFRAPAYGTWPPPHHTRILFESQERETNLKNYVRQVLSRFLSRAFRRPATDDEIERFVQIYNLIAPEVDSLEAAMQETLAMVLVAPQFLYHTVTESDTQLRMYETASKLSYFLWGSMPDAELMQLAADGRLDAPAVIKGQVLRLLADSRSRDFIDNFTTQWLDLTRMKTVPINIELFPRFLYWVQVGERRGTEVPYRPTIRDHMHNETVGFVEELVRRNLTVRNIVDSDFACLNQRLAAHYGVDGVAGHELRTVPLKPNHHLGGLLTHGSILIGNGTGTAPHPIYRAVWLREAILGDRVPPPPADVPALSDSAGDSAEKALTISALLAKHRRKESCRDCHSRLDPWGIPFERYNAVGKFQPMVPKEGTRVSGFDSRRHKDLSDYRAYVSSLNTVPVDAQSRVPGGPKVDGMPALKSYLLENRSDDIGKNVLRRLLSYGLGRELTWHDRFAVQELFEQTKAKDFRFRDMIVSICQSKLFRGRTQPSAVRSPGTGSTSLNP